MLYNLVRNKEEILELAGCDLLTISPNLLEELKSSDEPFTKKLDAEKAKASSAEKISLDEKSYRFMLNEDAMAVEKLSEGIRKFSADIVQLEKFIEENKVDYYLSLNKTQKTWKTKKEDISSWLLFFLKVVETQSEHALKLIEGDNFEYLLSEKQLALWQWALSNESEFSRKNAIEALKFPARTIEQIIKKLLDLNALERLGSGKATRYRISSKFKK